MNSAESVSLQLSTALLEDQLYLGHIRGPCAYLPDRNSSLLFLDGRGVGQLYRLLLDAGYRRHGQNLYRTDCAPCRECRVLRTPIATFRPSKSQRRVRRRGDRVFRYELGDPQADVERLELYRRYLRFQHAKDAPDAPGGDEDPAAITLDHYADFFQESFLGEATREMRFYATFDSSGEILERPAPGEERLVGIGIVDLVGDALSSVYFFFAPEVARFSPGVYSVLAEIEIARELGLRHYYPGFYIRDCAAMAYKINFAPNEIRTPDEGGWQRSEM